MEQNSERKLVESIVREVMEDISSNATSAASTCAPQAATDKTGRTAVLTAPGTFEIKEFPLR